MRRYDVDWLRVYALGLLIVYHIVMSFQVFGKSFLFIQNQQTLDELWPLMAMINVWRIPILFMVSGMGVCFAMERRTWSQLLKDRTRRILIPLVFGHFCIVPIVTGLGLQYYGMSGGQIVWIPNPGHLWFLVNIFLYVVLCLPLCVFFKNRPDNRLVRLLAKACRSPIGLCLFIVPAAVETLLMDPELFELFAGTPHGFFFGLVCFVTGFIFVSLKTVFWEAVERLRRGMLGLALGLYFVRLLVFELQAPNILTAVESMSWMLGVLGYGSAYLNYPSHTLAYFSKAVYPVYIVHLPLQSLFAFYIIPLALPALLKLALLLVLTFGVSVMLYEVIKRLTWLRPLFGMTRQQTPA